MRLTEGSLVLLLGDRRMRMPEWLEPAVRRLADDRPARVGDLADVVPDPGSRLVLVRRLIAEGLLRAEPVAGRDPARSSDAGFGDG